MTKALFINAHLRQVTECQINDPRDIQLCVGGYFEILPFRGMIPNVLYVNEEGLLKSFQYGFKYYGRGARGNGVLMGHADVEGRNTDVSVTVEETLKHIEWTP